MDEDDLQARPDENNLAGGAERSKAQSQPPSCRIPVAGRYGTVRKRNKICGEAVNSRVL